MADQVSVPEYLLPAQWVEQRPLPPQPPAGGSVWQTLLFLNDCGEAVKVIVGPGWLCTLTVTDCVALPPEPEQVTV